MEKVKELKQKKILVVDDSATNIEFIKEILSSERYHVQAAFTAIDALVLINREEPDLILLDPMIPGMDGFGLLSILKHNKDTKHIPVVVVSTISDSSNIQRSTDMGALEYVTKPFGIDRVFKLIDKYIN